MSEGREIWAIIPARYASTRLPEKMLMQLAGKPLLQWVWEGVSESKHISRILVATDHPKIKAQVESFGGEVRMTSPELQTGTDRVAEAVRGETVDIIVNVQGDEPLIRGFALDDLIVGMGSAPMATMARKITDPAALRDPSVVKVVTTLEGRALYFSRHAIPYVRDKEEDNTSEYWHHLGIYAYTREVLQTLVGLPQSPLERAEKLEQLRALQNGIAIQVVPTSLEALGVDTAEDLEKVEKLLRA